MQIPSNASPFAMLGAQKKNQATDPASFFTPAAEPESPAKKAFMDRMKMTPAEQMRASILESMGIKEEDLKNMDPKKREAIENKIKEMIKTKVEQAEEKKGVLVDIKA